MKYLKLYARFTTGNIPFTAGTGTYLATNSISEDAVTKQLQRVVLNNSSGVEQTIGTSLLALDSTVAKDASLTTIDTDIKTNIVLKAGTNIIGKVSQDTSPWIVSGTVLPTTTNAVSGIASVANTADTAVIAAQGAGNYIYITSISIVNTGATTSLVTIETDTASAKTAIWYMINPAGGGDNITFSTPLKISASNKNVGFVCGSSSTTQYCSISGYTGT